MSQSNDIKLNLIWRAITFLVKSEAIINHMTYNVDPSLYVCANILTFESIGKVLIVRDFNSGIGTYPNVEVDENVMVLDLMQIFKLEPC